MPAGRDESQKGSFPTPGGLRLVQAGFVAIRVLAGWRFYLFLLWARGKSADFVAQSPVGRGRSRARAWLLAEAAGRGRWPVEQPHSAADAARVLLLGPVGKTGRGIWAVAFYPALLIAYGSLLGP